MADSLKVVLLGDRGVGKTSIIKRLVQDSFSSDYSKTVGLDLYKLHLNLTSTVSVDLHLWDVSGDAIYHSPAAMLKNYLHAASLVFLVYDITSHASFRNLEECYKCCQKTMRGRLPRMAIIGNKSDMSMTRTVKIEDHQRLAAEIGCAQYFISAKTRDSLTQPFLHLSADCLGVSSDMLISRIEPSSVDWQQVASPNGQTSPNDNPKDVSETSQASGYNCMIQ